MSSYKQKRWEYKVVIENGTLDKRELNALGQKGWELVSFSHLKSGDFQYIFKQELDPLTPDF